jgi:hypothetical protein
MDRPSVLINVLRRCFVHTCPRQWGKWLSLAEFWYNTSMHSALGCSPFEILYGHKPRRFGLQPNESAQHSELNAWLKEIELMNQVIKQHLLRAQMRMKYQVDKKRIEISFSVGDQVFLNLQPYVQSSLANRALQKLAFNFFGSYKIIERIGSVPTDWTFLLAVLCSQLKKMVSSSTAVAPQLPDVAYMFQVPDAVLNSRMVHPGDAEVPQVLIKWSNMSPELATWEDQEALCQQFPHAAAWGQAAAQAQGDVSDPKCDVVSSTCASPSFVSLGPSGASEAGVAICPQGKPM